MSKKVFVEIGLIALFCMIFFLSANFSSGETRTVGKEGAEYSSIQDAVDEADPGDTIRVFEGTYEENVLIEKTLSLVGNGSSVTVVDAGGSGSAIFVRASWVNVSGFRCSGSGSESYDAGIRSGGNHSNIFDNLCLNNAYGICLKQSSHHVVENNTCRSNSGAGLQLDRTISSRILGNNFSRNERGIKCSSSEESRFERNLCSNNKWYGIRLAYSENFFLKDNKITGTESDGLYSMNSHGVIDGNEFVNNSQDGISVRNSDDAIRISNNSCSSNVRSGIYLLGVENTIVNNNVCKENGDGIRLYNAEACILENNSCSLNEYRGFYFQTGCPETEVRGAVSHSNGMSGLELSGNFLKVYNTISFSNGGSGLVLYDDCGFVENCTSHNNSNSGFSLSGERTNLTKSSSYYNSNGVAIQGSGNVIQNCNISWNHEYGFKFALADSNKVVENFMKENKEYGIYLNQADENLFYNNTISMSEIGIYVTAPSSEQACKDNQFFRNNISGNYDYGIDASGNRGVVVNATMNWWGRESGPYHPTENPSGEGDDVSNNVLIDPWIGRPFAFIDSISPNPSLDTEGIIFQGHGTPSSTIVRFVWRSSLHGVLYNGSKSSFSESGLKIGTHTIFLRVQNKDEVWSKEINTTLIIHERPKINSIKISPKPALHTDNITLEAEATDDGSIIQYFWESSLDGEIYRGEEKSNMVTGLSNGTHTITLKVKDNHDAWSEEISTELKINGKPSARVHSILPNLALDTDILVFNGSGDDDGSIKDFNWRITDEKGQPVFSGTTPPENLPLGNYSAFFSVQDDEEIWSDEVSRDFQVHTRPEAIITSITPQAVPKGNPLYFEGSGIDDGAISLYRWNSDIDGSISQNAKFQTSQLSLGSHTISFRVMDNHGVWSNWTVWPEKVKVNLKPTVVSLHIGPKVFFKGFLVEFNATTGDQDGTVVRFIWNSSIDGTLHDGETPIFLTDNLSLGTHKISLAVVDNDSAWSEPRITDVVITQRPEASIISIFPNPAMTTQKVTFTGRGTDADGSIKGYSWKIVKPGSDPRYGDEAKFTQNHFGPGEYNVSLKVQDNNGIWSEKAYETLIVGERPSARVLDITPNPAAVGELVSFFGDALDDGSSILYLWDFDDSDGLSVDSYQQNPTHTYTTSGFFLVTLTVVDEHGFNHTVNKYVWVGWEWVSGAEDPENDFIDYEGRPSNASRNIDISSINLYLQDDMLLFELNVYGTIQNLAEDEKNFTGYGFFIYSEEVHKEELNSNKAQFYIRFAGSGAELQDLWNRKVTGNLRHAFVNSKILIMVSTAEIGNASDMFYAGMCGEHLGGKEEDIQADFCLLVPEIPEDDSDDAGFIAGFELFLPVSALAFVACFRKRKQRYQKDSRKSGP